MDIHRVFSINFEGYSFAFLATVSKSIRLLLVNDKNDIELADIMREGARASDFLLHSTPKEIYYAFVNDHNVLVRKLYREGGTIEEGSEKNKEEVRLNYYNGRIMAYTERSTYQFKDYETNEQQVIYDAAQWVVTNSNDPCLSIITRNKDSSTWLYHTNKAVRRTQEYKDFVGPTYALQMAGDLWNIIDLTTRTPIVKNIVSATFNKSLYFEKKDMIYFLNEDDEEVELTNAYEYPNFHVSGNKICFWDYNEFDIITF